MASGRRAFIVLVEDQVQQNLVRRFLEQSGHDLRRVVLNTLPNGRGAGEQYVRAHFSTQLDRARRANADLIVVIDADLESIAHRRRQLQNPGETFLHILIPKRHIETWIYYALGASVDENVDCTRAPFSPPDSRQIKQAAARLLEMARAGASLGAPASLVEALPDLRRIAHA